MCDREEKTLDSNYITKLVAYKRESTLKRAGMDMLVGMISQDELKELREQFECIDKDINGTIEIEELRAVIKNMGVKMDKNELKKIIK